MDEKTKSLCARVRELVKDFKEENQHLYSSHRNYVIARRMYVRFKIEGANPNNFQRLHN
jgi:hypothetical protein